MTWLAVWVMISEGAERESGSGSGTCTCSVMVVTGGAGDVLVWRRPRVRATLPHGEMDDRG